MRGGVFARYCDFLTPAQVWYILTDKGLRIIFANHEWSAAASKGSANPEQLVFVLHQQPRMEGELGDIEFLFERHPVEGFDIVQMHLDIIFLRQLAKDERIVRAG